MQVVVLYGATGMIGSRILKELLSRGHHVKAVVRDASKVPSEAGVTAVAGDILDPDDVARIVKGADAVISAYAPGTEAGGVDRLLHATRSLIEGLKKAGVKRVLMVGGAGSLYVSPGVQLIDSGYLPEEWKPIAIAHRDALEVLRNSGLNWTSLCPAAFIQPGERTSKFRLGDENLVMDGKGESRISAEDFSIAMVDELEQEKHVGKRFTAAY